jgi:hypothetical protein
MIDSLISISCLTGFVGDASLQVLSQFMGGPTGWGLKEYFIQHGSIESLFIAGGMMTLFYVMYFNIFRLPRNLYYLALYGIILDLLFRTFRIFPSLDRYYKALNYFWSAVWGAIPMVLPLLVLMIINKLFV